jgi:hypothetical protein
MKCPVCKESMVILELNQIEVDYCPACSGVWFDDKELELLLEESDLKDKLTASFKKDENPVEKKIKCPICDKKMDKVRCGINGDILIDQCSFNHGLWFDKGELNLFAGNGKQENNDKLIVMLNDMFKYILNNK